MKLYFIDKETEISSVYMGKLLNSTNFHVIWLQVQHTFLYIMLTSEQIHLFHSCFLSLKAPVLIIELLDNLLA